MYLNNVKTAADAMDYSVFMDSISPDMLYKNALEDIAINNAPDVIRLDGVEFNYFTSYAMYNCNNNSWDVYYNYMSWDDINGVNITIEFIINLKATRSKVNYKKAVRID